MPDWKTGVNLGGQEDTYRGVERGFNIGKEFKHDGAFPICTSISLEIVLAERAIDAE
jgi:hypothetical protein